MLYKIFLRPVLFLFNPEDVHDFVLKFVSRASFLYPLLRKIYSPAKSESLSVGKLKFRNRLGLAAGFDKNGVALRFFDTIGFSHAEVGTVTPVAQSGNPKPRLFRLRNDKALINRMGFNNAGAEAVAGNILVAKKFTGTDFIIGVNIGKNKSTSIKNAYVDYKSCVEKLFDAADYFALNISSPNTEGLRLLQEEKYLDELLSEVQSLNSAISKQKGVEPKCIFLKIAPDLNREMLGMIHTLCVKHGICGITATNTTVTRENLISQSTEEGGLSGKPLKEKSDSVLEILSDLNKKSGTRLALIGTGGVFGKKDFDGKINAGADLVQLYTGFVYEGPSVVRKCLAG